MAAGDFSKPAIGSKVEVSLELNDVAGFQEITGLSNIDFTSPNIQRTTFELLNGRSIQRTGSAQANTLTAQMASNLSSPVFDALLKAKVNGTSLTFRYSTAPAESLYNSTEGSRNYQVAIASADGACTFTGSTGDAPNFGGDDPGNYAVGHVIQVGSTLYKIISIASASNNVNGNVIVEKPSADVAAADFDIVNPLGVITFQGSVTQIGNIASSPSAAVNTDTLEISANTVITAGQLVLSGV